MKTELPTEDELIFIIQQKLKAEDFVNANGMPIRSIRAEMDATKKSYAYNAEPCPRGHRLKDKHNRCVLCSTVTIGIRNHWRRSAYLYIAASKENKKIKVGSTIDKESRIKRIRKSFKSSDWEILYSIWCNESGRLEYEIHELLSSYRIDDYYHHNAGLQKTREVYQCSYLKAFEALSTVMKNNNLNHKGLNNVAFPMDYDFRNLIK